MIRKKLIATILIAVVFAFGGVSTASAYDCNHIWTDSYDGYNCQCIYCGMYKPHNWVESCRDYGSCEIPQSITYHCSDCYAEHVDYGSYGSHDWSDTLWWDLDDEDGENHYIYGKYCETCDEFQKVVLTVKKGKTKRILPKKFLKHSKKRYVSYNKKKVKATKKGMVKGKKRGAVATIKWDIQYKNHRGYRWWELYEADVRIK